MYRISSRWLLPAVCTLTLGYAQAQATAPTPQAMPARALTPDAARPGPTDALAAVPAVIYRSSLASYRRLSAEPGVPWREANETVGRIGGWRAYAREAAAPEPPPAALPASTSAATPGQSMPAPAMPAKPVLPGHGSHQH